MIYFIVLFILLLFSIFDELLEIKKKRRRVIYFFSIVIVVLLIGLRGNIEPDYINYLDIFNTVRRDNVFSDSSVEIGYSYYNLIIKYFLLLPFQFVVFSIALITIWLKFKFFREQSPKYLISFLLYYCSLLFLYEFIAIRQALAMSIFMLSIPYIIERKLVKFLICVLIASLFHISAIIVLPLYFFINKKFNNFFVLTVLLICLFLNVAQISLPVITTLSSFFSIASVNSKLEIYSSESEFALISIRLLLFAFIFLIYKWFTSNDKKFNFYFNIFFVGIIFTTLFNEIPQFSYRIKAYFLWTDVILWVLIIENSIKKQITLKIILYTILIVIYSITLIDFLNVISERGNYIYPYKFFWEFM